MKTIILSAGQGKRLLPLTAKVPKCLLRIQGKTMVEKQIDTLHRCGVDDITVVTGYRAEKVDNILRNTYGRGRIKTLYNSEYATTDNLVSCWTARNEMNQDFILLNGDTLFEAAVLKRLLSAPENPVTVVVNRKENYDADDMKVEMEGSRLVRIGKQLPLENVKGESIGMILFRGEGPGLFRNSLKEALQEKMARKKWYLSVIDRMARVIPIWTCAITGLRWCEVDYHDDLKQAERIFSDFHTKEALQLRDAALLTDVRMAKSFR